MSRVPQSTVDQVLDVIREKPGVTIPGIAEQLGCRQNVLYRVIPRLITDERIKRDGIGWKVIA